MKRIYIAAPFFNPEQLSLVQDIEQLILTIPGLEFYSPRLDGVLQDMSHEERKASYKKVFLTNVVMMYSCEGMIALLDRKDTGTTWELGYGYALSQQTRYQIMGFTSTPDVKLNVMLGQCLQAHAVGIEECKEMLIAFINNTSWEKKFAGEMR